MNITKPEFISAGAQTKRLAISKANAQVVATVAVASFVTIFCLIASKTLLSQYMYQSRVISAQNIAKTQLTSNIQTFNTILNSYENFNSEQTNIIGGSSTGTSYQDGDNAKIVLDALPDAYDFPALTASVEKILNGGSFQVTSITGTDNELAQQGVQPSASPAPVSMPFSFTIDNSNYQSIQQVVGIFQNSIRPMAIDSITISGGGTDMTLTLDAHTYYQPPKGVSITTQVVK